MRAGGPTPGRLDRDHISETSSPIGESIRVHRTARGFNQFFFRYTLRAGKVKRANLHRYARDPKQVFMFGEVVFHLSRQLAFSEQVLKRFLDSFVGVADVGRRTVERGNLAFDRGGQFFVGKPDEVIEDDR